MTSQQGDDGLSPPQIASDGVHTALAQARQLHGVLRGGVLVSIPRQDPPQPAGDDTHLGDGVGRRPYQPKEKTGFSGENVGGMLGGADCWNSGVFRDSVLSCMEVCAKERAPILIIPNPKTAKRGRLSTAGRLFVIYHRSVGQSLQKARNGWKDAPMLTRETHKRKRLRLHETGSDTPLSYGKPNKILHKQLKYAGKHRNRGNPARLYRFVMAKKRWRKVFRRNEQRRGRDLCPALPVLTRCPAPRIPPPPRRP